MLRVVAGVIVVLLLTSAGFGQDVAATTPEMHTYARVNEQSLELHVFRGTLESDKPSPAILVFHGGGWAYGDAEWAFPRAMHFAERGLVGIAVQYDAFLSKLGYTR